MMLQANSVSRLRAGIRTRRGPNQRLARWIGAELAAAPPKARSLVVTVWGDSIAPHGGSVWLSGLIRLMASFGMNERLVRTSVYRLVEEGWLEARQNGRRSLYRLTPQGARRFENAYRRIYVLPSRTWNGEWELVITRPERLRPREHDVLRKELWWEGFGNLGRGMFIRPARSAEAAAVTEIVDALDLPRKVWRFSAIQTPTEADKAAPGIVQACWDLTAVRAEYVQFMRRFRPLRHALASQSPTPEQAFVARTLLIHAFRRTTLHDPQLPSQLLSRDWPGAEAYALCREIYRRTRRQAELHLKATLQGVHGALPPVAAYFLQRFGGLGN